MTPPSTPGTGSATSNEAEPSAPPEARRRPAVGGAAAWREGPGELPRRPRAELLAPEQSRYGTKTAPERLADIRGWFVANRRVLLPLTLLLLGWTVVRILTPAFVGFSQLEAGDCIDVRTGRLDGDGDVDPMVAAMPLVRDAVLRGGSTTATCLGPHGHEVVGVIDLSAGNPVSPYPGPDVLRGPAEDGCAAAYAARLGRPPGSPGDDFTLAVIVSDELHWLDGVQRAVCLAQRADLELIRPAEGGDL